MIASEHPSIICLQEVIQNTDELTLLVRGKGYKASVSTGPNNRPSGSNGPSGGGGPPDMNGGPFIRIFYI